MKSELEIRERLCLLKEIFNDKSEKGYRFSQRITYHTLIALEWVLDLSTEGVQKEDFYDSTIEEYKKLKKRVV